MATPKLLTLMVIPVIALGACDEIANTDKQKTRNGAVIGAAVGAATQMIAGNSNSSALKGAIVGGVIGGVIGNVLDKQEADLRNDLAGSGATITNTGSELVVTLPEAITFDTDSTYVRASLEDDLSALASNLNDYPDSTIDVIGHTDSDGDDAYNQNLSARRAQAVSSVLSTSNVSADRIRSYGRGELEPVQTNDSDAGRAANRRVEIVIQPNA